VWQREGAPTVPLLVDAAGCPTDPEAAPPCPDAVAVGAEATAVPAGEVVLADAGPCVPVPGDDAVDVSVSDPRKEQPARTTAAARTTAEAPL
jgi:hypothetical protein